MSDIATNPLLGLLQEQALLDDLQLEEVNNEVTKSGKSAFQVIQDFGHLDKDSLLSAIANHMGAMVVEVNEQTVTPELKEIINGEAAQTYQCVPVAIEDGVLQVALVDPLDPSKIDEMGYVIPFPIQLVVADPSAVENALSSAYGASGGGGGLDIESGIGDILKELGVESDDLTGGKKVIMSEDTLDISDDEDSAPIVKFVNLVLAQAVQDRASDIHFEPFENEYKIRYRVDGALYEMAPPPKAMSGPIASRIKIMSNLNISESRLPQDGRISVNLGGKQIDLRVSTLPTSYGESVVLRVLDRTAVTLELETLGFPPEILEFTTHAIDQPNGIFVVTGPTGCGKTTTLYSCLRRVNRPGDKLLTVEDPVEFDIEGILQVPVIESVGMTFAAGLRAFLRQDPDIIMVGEMRDLETSQIAIQASLTGHLVLSTLHTNDAPGTVTRLTDMGVEPFLVSSTLIGVMGQRLVRTICDRCKTPFEPTEQQLEQLGLTVNDLEGKKFAFGRGCGECNDSGYRGRKGIFELLQVTDDIRALINERSPSVVLKQKAVEEGMITLRDDGLRSVFNGETAIDEVLKYT
jgi:type IV pilus assembly protein PilB